MPFRGTLIISKKEPQNNCFGALKTSPILYFSLFRLTIFFGEFK